MEFSLLKMDIFALKYSSRDKIESLKYLKTEFGDLYKAKYLNLLSELYFEAHQFSSVVSDDFDEEDEDDMDRLLKYFEDFIVSYTRLIRYFEFANVDCPTQITKDFNTWKNNRDELLEEVE